MTAVPPRSILHVAQSVDSGVPAAAAALVRDQVARGWRVAVASPRESTLRELAIQAGARWHAWPATRAPGPSAAAETVRLARIVRRAEPTLVHLHSAKAGLAGRLAVRGRRPTVFQPQAWSFEAAGRAATAARAWERLASSRWTDLLLCVSEDERRRGESAGVAGRYAVVPNGVDLERFPAAGADERASARAALGLPVDAPVAVCVGRLAEQKGQDTALAAWPAVRVAVPGARLVLVGHGPMRAQLEAAAGDGIDFVGARDDVHTWLAAADLVVQPSRWEGLSLTVLEALASARSVVASDAPGMSELVDGDAGALFPVGDADGFAVAVAARLRDPALAEREGRAGRRRVEEHYAVSAVAARVAALYDDVLAQP